MEHFILNKRADITKITVGHERIPLLIIDDFFENHETLIEQAGDGSLFISDAKNFYPGKRRIVHSNYANQICAHYFSLLNGYFGIEQARCARSIASAYAISDMQPKQLRPMQMLPHFDTTDTNQLAVVHYLCHVEHGGTSFYRHRASNFEVITTDRLVGYASTLKKEAMANQLHLNPCYMNGSNDMFEQIATVKAKMNRAIIYPSNALHSGDVNSALGLSLDPQKGRLTVGSFIELV
ncbi:DUF6445 family protein [Colwellia sp. MSW7]|uniref:DUF6445 family protein n=1 Tax=Colwellia maritima TaxID=2912588 RepID=A0ABS9WYJ6_9GAMM|nr:DUF6445 family protein [Colwellia maritima]MCI2283078.1 DUF6445 family protein [Colwellia maritima]